MGSEDVVYQVCMGEIEHSYDCHFAGVADAIREVKLLGTESLVKKSRMNCFLQTLYCFIS